MQNEVKMQRLYDFSRYLLLLLVTLAVLAGCGGGSADATADAASGEDADEESPIPVEVEAVTRGDIVAVYSGTAALEAEEQAQVIAKVGGEIKRIDVEEGDHVTAGQVLAELDGDRLRLELARANANLSKLQNEYERDVELHAKGLITEQSFESSRFELASLKAAVDLASLELSYTRIRAPIDGVIAERQIKIGNTITVNTPTFVISDLDPLVSYLHVPEREFNKLQPGQKAEITIDALENASFSGLIARISPVVDPTTGTFKVTIEADDEGGQLKPGMFGRFNIVYDVHQEAVLIPRAAIVDDQAELSVFVIEDDVARRRIIRTGLANGSAIEVTDGLTGAERIVTIGQTGLRDGGKVQIIEASETSSTMVAADTSTTG